MSVPDNSRPKAPPSLLADVPAKPAGAPASGAQNGSRILANLEGRVVPPVPPAGKTQRSSKAAGLVALLVIGAGAFGAWHWMSRTQTGGSNVSNASSVAATAASATRAGAVAAASAVPASHVIVANASKTGDASASHAATIVADDDAANANAKAGDSDRISRALADGSAAATAAPVAPQAKPVQQAQTPEKNTAKHKSATEGKQEKQEKANAHKSDSKTAVAQSKKAHADGKHDDSDVDLLAVLVARTKPADAKQGGSTHGPKTSAKATDGNASLAQQVKACSERGFFEDQLCRWRVCDGHWGKDPACPQAAKASSEH
ncbi:hypothetical protein F4827_002581 [Paraburkholderia bannensis]|uniref:Uncharacterized protein n=1 Tax=Paraburkholderia bannensis TaxID=765414 RepID=A0A7W9TX58_9BURK|nr:MULTISPECIES: hypothetical protein [Paraburkholderia]MBB3257716.1 hypothetical protein [Paraburkholderia sp. WP4_3_2]MBB6102729.1 hypothetical protein [Paraburkholderia bannensis]